MSRWNPFRGRDAPPPPGEESGSAREEQSSPREEDVEVEDLPQGARIELVRAYHRATCHHFHRFASGPGYLDWANQPDPFRRYAGCELLPLAHSAAEEGARYDEVWRADALQPVALEGASLSRLFEYALGISAWKEYQGARWALRIDPSSGNLHPTEAHLVAPPLDGLCDTPFIAHYAPREHALELRARLTQETWNALAGSLAPGTFLIALSSIHWREAWKYGERAWRYCQHDAGHALACVSLSAAALGWNTRLIEGWSRDDLRGLLGLAAGGRAEPEVPDLLLALTTGARVEPQLPPPDAATLAGIRFHGEPNVLSDEHVEWRAIEFVSRACAGPRTPAAPVPARLPALHFDQLAPSIPAGESFGQVARRRRSAVAMDAKTCISRAGFYRCMARLQATAGARPFDALPWAPRVALGLFVHRVEDLDPGLYALARGARQLELLRREMRPDFLWERATEAPEGLELYLLARGLVRSRAASVSCQQEIAGDGAFSLGMLAEFDGPLSQVGAWVYPRLYWECGAIGQVLYLEAEALGLRATGIGCFFDEPVHETFGVRSEALRSLYHFTVGGPVEDARLTSRAPYPPPETLPLGHL